MTRSQLQKARHCPAGSWALVTGASDGIGKGFAEELLEEGFEVLLHGRNDEKLRRVQEELQRKHPKRKIETVVADASASGHPEQSLVDKVATLPGKLTVLINNVGGMCTHPQYVTLGEIESDAIDAQINTNLRFPTHLTKALLPTLLANGPAVIGNCCSGGGIRGLPYMTVYCSTKSYIENFTRTLAAELRLEGVPRHQLEIKGFVIVNVQSAGNTTDKNFMTFSARDCAKNCLDRVGHGELIEGTHWKDQAQLKLLPGMPQAMLNSEMKKRRAKEQEEIAAGKA